MKRRAQVAEPALAQRRWAAGSDSGSLPRDWHVLSIYPRLILPKTLMLFTFRQTNNWRLACALHKRDAYEEPTSEILHARWSSFLPV